VLRRVERGDEERDPRCETVGGVVRKVFRFGLLLLNPLAVLISQCCRGLWLRFLGRNLEFTRGRVDKGPQERFSVLPCCSGFIRVFSLHEMNVRDIEIEYIRQVMETNYSSSQ